MRFLSLSLLAFAASAVADKSPQEYSPAAAYVEAAATTDSSYATVNTASPASHGEEELSYNASLNGQWESLPHGLKQFIMEMGNKQHLVGRQAAAAGAAAAAASPTQLSPVTVYDIGQGPQTYTQTFPSTPGPFPAPTSGSIGLGTIQGQVGKVRTYSNPAPTASVDPRLALAVAGGIGAGMLI